MPEGVVGIGSTHHFALRVDSAEEQEAWRDYLREHGVDCTDVLRPRRVPLDLRHAIPTATSSRSPRAGTGFGAGGPPA